MIQPLRFNEDPLLKDFPDTAKKFEYENMIMVVLHPEKKEFDWIVINKENPGVHYHFYQEKGEIYFVITRHLKNGKKEHEHIELEKAMAGLSNVLSDLFSKAEKLDISDSRFAGKRAFMLTGTKLFIDNLIPKKVTFNQDVDYDDTLFENIDIAKNSFGVILDDDENEIATIFVNSGDVYRLNLEKYDSEEYQFDSIMKYASTN